MKIFTSAHTFGDNSLINFLIPVTKGAYLFSALALIGLLMVLGFFIPDDHGRIKPSEFKYLALTKLAALVLIFTVIGFALLELANLLGQSLLDAFNLTTLHSFLTQTTTGRNYLFQIITFVAVSLIVNFARKVGAIYFAFGLTLLGVLVPLFTSHASNAGNHGLAIGSIIFHVGAISLWVGGLFALMILPAAERARSLPRFSAIAFWAAITVGISGLINAWTRLHFLAGWNSLYGFLVALKVLLMAILIALGARQRKYLAHKISDLMTYRLIINELAIMAITVAIGAWLSTTAPPVSASDVKLEADPILGITGIPMPHAPNLARVIWMYVPDGAMLGLLILLTALYIKGVLTLTRRGDKWPVGRTVAFAMAIAVTDFATSGGLGVYAHFAFSYHMISHMLLGMVAPIGFVLSAPITLMMRALPHSRDGVERGLRGTLIQAIHSRYSKIITFPVVALVIFDGSLFALYMTPLFGSLMRSHSGHFLMNIHFLLAGYLFFYVIVGVDPNPRKIPHIVRIITLFAAMSIHAYFSIALLSTSTLVDGGFYASLHRTWNVNLLADQHLGGAIGWAMGEVPILIALIATFIQWTRDDSRESKRIDRAADRAEAMGEDDELAKYNKYLASLNNANRKNQQ